MFFQRLLKAMEDAHVALPDFDPENGVSLFGVFDGHGGTGCHKASQLKHLN